MKKNRIIVIADEGEVLWESLVLPEQQTEIYQAKNIQDALSHLTVFSYIESYIWFLQSNVIRTTGMDCPLPEGDTETQAQAMFRHLDKIGGLTLLEG